MGFHSSSNNLFDRQKVTFSLSEITAKCAKAASLYTYISKVYVSVDDISYNVSTSPSSQLISN
jgi:hypothetical protein